MEIKLNQNQLNSLLASLYLKHTGDSTLPQELTIRPDGIVVVGSGQVVGSYIDFWSFADAYGIVDK